MTRRWHGRVIGALALVASLAFLFADLRSGLSEISWSDLDGELLARWLAAFSLYLVGLVYVHTAWGVVVARAGQGTGIVVPAVISGRAQIGKYLPGNVGHFAGRHMLAARQGWSQPAVMGASAVEIVGFVFSGALVVSAGVLLGVNVDIDVPRWAWLAGAACAAASLVVVGFVVLTGRHRRLRALAMAAGSATPIVLAMYLSFMLLAGLGQWLLLEGTQLGTVVVAATAALLVGFLTPGVPAGIGVREAVLAGTLSVQPANLTVGLIAFRGVTVLSDLIVFLVASALATRLVGPREPHAARLGHH